MSTLERLVLFLDKHVKSESRTCALVYTYIVLVNWKLAKNNTSMDPVRLLVLQPAK